MYWRMLAVNPTVAEAIVLAEKPAITTDSDRMDRGALDQLLLHTGTLGSIYHKNPEVCCVVVLLCCRLAYTVVRLSSEMQSVERCRTVRR